MRLTITIDMDNAAFTEFSPETEVKQILTNFVNRLDPGDLDETGVADVLLDSNGNRVGQAKVENLDGPTPEQQEAQWGKVSRPLPPDTLTGMVGR